MQRSMTYDNKENLSFDAVKRQVDDNRTAVTFLQLMETFYGVLKAVQSLSFKTPRIADISSVLSGSYRLFLSPFKKSLTWLKMP